MYLNKKTNYILLALKINENYIKSTKTFSLFYTHSNSKTVGTERYENPSVLRKGNKIPKQILWLGMTVLDICVQNFFEYFDSYWGIILRHRVQLVV